MRFKGLPVGRFKNLPHISALETTTAFYTGKIRVFNRRSVYWKNDILSLWREWFTDDPDVLKPCPFCGCTDHETSPFPIDRNKTAYECVCGNPDCQASIIAPTAKEAVGRWNRRYV
ncbi:MAG: hypothetical protein KAS32_23650 [Candidatus Peribacteraceae bacterium]|nr:hypothetical protein [Candidatus Peribacteraceae bacterium]